MLVLLQRVRRRSNCSNPNIHLSLIITFYDPDYDLGEASTDQRMADEEDHKYTRQHYWNQTQFPFSFTGPLSQPTPMERMEGKMQIGSEVEAWIRWPRCSGTKLRNKQIGKLCCVPEEPPTGMEKNSLHWVLVIGKKKTRRFLILHYQVQPYKNQSHLHLAKLQQRSERGYFTENNWPLTY